MSLIMNLPLLNIVTERSIDEYVIWPNLKKMTTPSRKLRHTAEASLTVFPSYVRLGKHILLFLKVLYRFVKFYNFL